MTKLNHLTKVLLVAYCLCTSWVTFSAYSDTLTVSFDTNQVQQISLDTNQLFQVLTNSQNFANVQNEKAMSKGLWMGFSFGALLLGFWWIKGMWNTFLGGDRQDD